MNKEELLAAYVDGRRDFTGVDLSEVDLQGANLRDADLRGADFQHANLSDANLTGATLCGAALRGADLCNANLMDANLMGANLRGADLRNANLRGVNLRGAILMSAGLTGAIGFRFPGSPDPLELRRRVAEQIREHPELHDQSDWGGESKDASCGTPCCVAGWACRLGGGDRGHSVPAAAIRLLHCDGYRLPSFAPDTTREDILRDLLVPIKEQND